MAMTGKLPARPAPGRNVASLLLALCLVLPAPAAAEDDEPSASGGARVEQERNPESGAPKEVRPALARRKKNALNQFDPKVYEARGRELQGEYYEIANFANSADWSASPAEVATSAPSTSSSKHWIIWTGAAGLAALVGGAAGYLMLDKHTAPEPITVNLDDKP